MRYSRTNRALAVLLAALSALFAACAPQDASVPASAIPTDERNQYLEQSEAMAGKLQKALGSRLMAAMKGGDTSAAIGVCQRLAQDITEIVGDQSGNASISRTALRVRNPVNRPDPDSIQVLEDWEATLKAGQKLQPSLLVNEDRVIVHRPIMTAAICLQCHGEPEHIQPETRRILETLYPEDEATGFAEGSLRGAFRIEFARQ